MQITLYTVPQDLKKGDLVAISEQGEIIAVNFPKNDLKTNSQVSQIPVHGREVKNRRPTYKLQIDREKIVRSLDNKSMSRGELVYSLLGNNPDRLMYTYLVDDLNSLVKVSKRIKIDEAGLYSQVK